MRIAVLMLAGSSLLRFCGSTPAAPAAQPPTAAAPRAGARAMIPEHNGQVTVSGGLTTEVVAQADGHLLTYVRDTANAPVTAYRVEVSVRKPDGQMQAVPVTYDAARHVYVGRPVGLPPGQYPVQVSVQPTQAAVPVQLLTPPVTVTAATIPPPARFGGRVQVVGDQAVELVTSQSGEVAMFWMDLQGVPLPARDVSVTAIDVTVDGRPQTVAVHIEGDHHVGHAPAFAANANVAVAVPSGVVRGAPFQRLEFARPVLVAAIPAAPVAMPPPGNALVGSPIPNAGAAFAPPAVALPPAGPVYAPPPSAVPVGTPPRVVATGTVFAPPPPSGVVAVHAMPPPSPAVVVTPPPPPSAMVAVRAGGPPRATAVVAQPGYVVAQPPMATAVVVGQPRPLATAVVVAPPPPTATVVIEPPRPPTATVVIAQPAPAYVVERPAPRAVVVEQGEYRGPRGRGRGGWRNGGAIIIEGPPPPPVVIIGGGGGWHGRGGWHGGHGGHGGHGRGHGRD